MAVAAQFIRKPQPFAPGPQAVAAMDCNNFRQLDTAALYGIQLQQQQPAGPCEAYQCGSGWEWWGRIDLPAGVWRLKVRPKAGLLCTDVLAACDSLCSNTMAAGPVEVDWKSPLPHRRWIHFSASQGIPVEFEVGRWESGQPCNPTWWGKPCK
jgi:hypothetical protein